MMARAKRIYILIIKVNKLFPFFWSRCFLKEIENMFSVFLSSYRNTCQSLGDSKKLWKHSLTACVPTAFLVLPNFHSCFYLNNRVFLSRNYRLIVAPRKFDVLKTNICPRSEYASFKNIKFPRGNCQTDSSET